MKKIFLTILSFAALLGCSEGDHGVTPATPGAISFGNVATRAGLADLQKNGFGVWAVHFNDAQPYGYLLLDKKEVTYDGANWVYSPVEYWIPKTVFNFMATYPRDSFESMIYEEGDAKLNYVALTDFKTTAEADVDILGASAMVDTSSEDFKESDPVNLQFQHLLCKINVCLMQDGDQNRDDNFIIDKVTLSGVKSKGSYYYFPVKDEIASWWDLDQNATINFEREFTDNANIGLSGKRYLSDDGLLLIPQQITAKTIKLTINFRFGAHGTEDINLYEPKTLEAYLPASDDLWQSGKSITYNVKVSTYNPITFLAPTIAAWGNLASGGTIIIK